MAPAGTAEQDAPPTDWVVAKIGRVVFLLTWRTAGAGSRGREGDLYRSHYPFH